MTARAVVVSHVCIITSGPPGSGTLGPTPPVPSRPGGEVARKAPANTGSGGGGFGETGVFFFFTPVKICAGGDMRTKALVKGLWCGVNVLTRTGASERKRYKKDKALEVQAIAVGVRV